MDSKIKKKFGTLLKIGNQMLLHWIAQCPPMLHVSAHTANTKGALANRHAEF